MEKRPQVSWGLQGRPRGFATRTDPVLLLGGGKREWSGGGASRAGEAHHVPQLAHWALSPLGTLDVSTALWPDGASSWGKCRQQVQCVTGRRDWGVYALDGRVGCSCIWPERNRGPHWGEGAAEMQAQCLITFSPKIYFKTVGNSTAAATLDGCL
jgi:hypothetical protein